MLLITLIDINQLQCSTQANLLLELLTGSAYRTHVAFPIANLQTYRNDIQ